MSVVFSLLRRSLSSPQVKERFSLLGGRVLSEAATSAAGDPHHYRRGHRRRRSGGDSSTGGASVASVASGSSAGLGSLVGLTVWR